MAEVTDKATGSSITFKEAFPLYKGDILKAKLPIITRGNQKFEIGDKFVLVKKTRSAPFGIICSSGNWLVKTKYGETVWGNLQLNLAEGCCFEVVKSKYRETRLNKSKSDIRAIESAVTLL